VLSDQPPFNIQLGRQYTISSQLAY